MKVEYTDEQRRGKVVAGVDTHDGAHVLCVLSECGAVIRTGEFPATGDGYDELAAAIGGSGGCLAVGVEGTASYGAGLTRRLLELGYLVFEVLRPRRAGRRGRAKNDALDAERAARDVWSCAGSLSSPKRQDGWVGRLRFLSKSRDSLVKSCTRLANTAQSLAKTAPDDVRSRYRGMRSGALMPLLAAEGGGSADPVMASLAALAAAWEAAREGADALEGQMRALLRENCPALLAIDGLGAVGAARIAVAVGDNPGRIGSEAQLAALFGASPVCLWQDFFRHIGMSDIDTLASGSADLAA
jgi:transposase